MNTPERERGWCSSCGDARLPDESSPPDNPICPECGRSLTPLRNLTRNERSRLAFMDWQDDVYKQGLWGPSPGGAVSELGCDRSMIDKLAAMGILEKNIYDRDGHYVVLISDRSIKKAKENKKKTGKWTDSGED